jgi:hypothetical protein
MFFRRNVCASAVVAVAALPIVAACRSSHDAGEVVPIPSSSIAVAALAGERAAVLAGDKRAKAIYVVDLARKTVLFSFGVPKEATGISAVSDEGPLLVSLGAQHGKQSTGAVERWTIDGTETGTLPLPAPGLTLTRTLDGIAYVLVGHGATRAAIGLRAWPLRTTRAVPLESNLDDLEACRFAGRWYLVYSTANRHIALRDVVSGATRRSTAFADDPTCIDGRNEVYAVSRTFGAANVVILKFPHLDQVAAIPVSNTVIGLYDSGDRRLMALDSTTTVGTLEILPRSALRVAAEGLRQ